MKDTDKLTDQTAIQFVASYFKELEQFGGPIEIIDTKHIRNNWFKFWGKPDAIVVLFTFPEDNDEKLHGMTVWLTDQYNQDGDTELHLYGEW